MDLNKLTLFGLVKGRMGWLTKRQEVLAQNVANSDTPGYKPKDLKPFDFQELVRRQERQRMATAQNPQVANAGAGGLSGRATSPFKSQNELSPYETAPDGNAVVLEQQMAKIGETQMQYQLTNELYRKHINMIKIAIGKGR